MNRNKSLDFERKHEEDLQRLRGFRLLDDDFMSKVFEDKKCAEFLLRIILNRDDLEVKKSNSQYSIKNLQGRSVRLDILAVDKKNRVYNIEIQRNDKGAGVKRARYNSAVIDANVTEPGEKYEKLNETYVIFITENDVLERGLPIYHIDRVIKETGEVFQDESHIIYVNSQMRNETARETCLETARSLLTIGKLTYEEIAQATKLTVDEVKELDKNENNELPSTENHVTQKK